MEPNEDRIDLARLESLERSVRGVKMGLGILFGAIGLLIVVAILPALGVGLVMLGVFLGALLFIAAIRFGLEKLSPPAARDDNDELSGGRGIRST